MTFSTAEEKRLRELLDRQAIWDALMNYTRGVDRVDEELVRAAFWSDAHDAHGGVSGSPDQFLQWFLPNQPARDTAQHIVTNHSVRFLVDGVARSETYFVSVAKRRGESEVEMVGGRYQDEWERRDGEWRISTRIVLLDWQIVSDASGMADRLARSRSGSRDRNDPSYLERLPRLGPVVPPQRPAAG